MEQEVCSTPPTLNRGISGVEMPGETSSGTEYRFGYFSQDGSEFVITDPATPRAFDNFLWNRAVYSNVQQTGVGTMDYQIGDTEGIQLLTGVGRICDFDVFGRDHLMSRLIYVRDNRTGDFWTINWEPVCAPYEYFRCTHGMGYSRIESGVNGIAQTFRIFVPDGNDPVELWTLELKNDSPTPRDLSVFVYVQFQLRYKWGFDSYGDMLYRGVWFDDDLNSVVASKHPFRRPHNYLTAFLSSNAPIVGFDGSRDAFVGMYRTLASPRAVEEGKCRCVPGSSEATVGAIQFGFHLDAGESVTWDVLLGATDGTPGIAELRHRYLGRSDAEFSVLQERTRKLMGMQHIHSPDPHFDRMLNFWAKRAALFGASWCRWGWNGYRDIVQHGLGVAAFQPHRTREILVTAMRHQYQQGFAPRGWNPLDEKPYSDSALWLVFALTAYLRVSGDFSFLDEDIPYLDSGSCSVLDHIRAALDFLETNRGVHGLCLIKFGDWNDSLTGVGKEGRGESVWLSMAYAEALREMKVLLEYLGQNTVAAGFETRRQEMLANINAHAWDGKWYLRCFDDDGQPIGSSSNEFGKIFMEPQSWALISGTADPERARHLVESCDAILATPSGYRLLDPPFTRLVEKVGRLSSLEPGICENGTIYSHLNIWMILGLLRYGMADKAYEVFRQITAGYMQGENDTKHQCPPFLFANCYYGPGHRNNAFQMEFTWITGSVAWFNTVLIQEMLGVKAHYDGLLVDPCLPSSWPQCRVEQEFRGARYIIDILNPHALSQGHIVLEVDGVSIQGNKLPVFADGKTHHVTARILPPSPQPH